MVLVDTSAWVEFLRDTGSAVCQAVDQLLEHQIATCDTVRMEVLAGARNEQHLQQLRGLLARATTIPTTPADFDHAAALYRVCRVSGETDRKLVDCLIATAAIKANFAVLHNDQDYEVLARHTDLRVYGIE
ncbi:MAG: PIN domain nuclease [Xanthomonadales bacterium]|nr:PIN domain nuclease [Xanthomonadales bacterium]